MYTQPKCYSINRAALSDLKGRFPLDGLLVVVADRGVVSEPLLKALEGAEQEYIVGIPLHKWKAADKVLRWPGTYHEVAYNLRVKEAQLDGKRYILCDDPERETDDARRRMEIVAVLEKELAEGDLAKLVKKKGYGRYITIEEKAKTGVNWAAGKSGCPLWRQVPLANSYRAISDGASSDLQRTVASGGGLL